MASKPLTTTALFSAALLSATAALAKDTGHLFISSEKDHAIRVLDGKTFKTIKDIRTAARPRHLQFNPDKTLIYAACGDGNAIDVIDVATLELIDRIGPIDDPELFDLSANGKIMYISLEDDAKLGILDLNKYFANREEKPELVVAEITQGDDDRDDDDGDDGDDDNGKDRHGDDDDLPGLTTVEVGEEPEGVLASSDGNTVYVTSEVANVVHVVDINSGELKANIVVGNRPRRFAMTPDRKELWVTNELGATVTIIDAANNTISGSVKFTPKGFRQEDVTPVGIAMAKDGKTAFVGLGRANHVAVVDVASRNVEKYILVGKRAWNATFSRDESTLYVVNGLSDDISIVDVAARKVRRSVATGRVPHTVLIDD
ncbi:MAG: beta-propeller fold lactonase family protein [Gammaproteobacteria bacterium]|nr:beta-propeller fold lactonase family protein [Gammaproteobacteria bacterium]